MKGPVIIEIEELKSSGQNISSILRPKVAKAKRLTKEQARMMEAYRLFKMKYVQE